jgi:hypothetical protein
VKTSAMVLGLIGGVIGLLAGVLEIAFGGTISAFDGDGGQVVALGFVTFALAVAGIVGAALAGSRPGWSGGLQLVAGVAGFFTCGLFWLLSGPLLVLGGLFAWRESYSRERRVPV